MRTASLALLISVIAPALNAEVASPAITARPLLNSEDAYPHVSHNGRVVFQSNRVGGTKLFTMRLDAAEPRQLTTGPGEDRTPKWSPDGNRIAFASTRDGNEDVWIINADGSGERNLTRHAASDSHPSWSPDGRQIVFCSTRGDGENDDIYIVDIDGSGLRRLTDNGLAWDTFPSFSPDGRQILFRRLLRQRTPEGTLVNSEIFVMDRDGKNPVNLSRSPYFDGWPAWSPDGRQIAFSSNRSDVYQLYVMNMDGAAVKQVTQGAATDVRPQWMPDGAGLVFNREHDGQIEIWQIAVPRTP